MIFVMRFLDLRSSILNLRFALLDPQLAFFDPPSSILDPQLVLAFFLPLVISLLGAAVLLRWAPRMGLIDEPNDRKIHARAIPTGGGLAIFAAWAITVSLPGFQFESVWVIGAAGLIMVVLGLADDLRPIAWQVRLGVQTATAIAALLFLGRFISAHHSILITPYLFWPLTVLWLVGLINAFNMLDNMDALSGGVAWIAAALLIAAMIMMNPSSSDEIDPISQRDPTETAQHSELSTQHSLLALMGALTGFLWFNRPPARIFMGDAGSTFLGFFLGIASLQVGFMDLEMPQTWIIILCILAVPCYDLTSVVFLRLRQGRSPFRADKQHLSHRLVNLGLSPPAAVGVIYLLALAIGGGGLLLYHSAKQGSLFALLYLVCWWIGLAAFEYWTRRNREFRIDN